VAIDERDCEMARSSLGLLASVAFMEIRGSRDRNIISLFEEVLVEATKRV